MLVKTCRVFKGFRLKLGALDCYCLLTCLVSIRRLKEAADSRRGALRACPGAGPSDWSDLCVKLVCETGARTHEQEVQVGA
jgi:hypothetical protein